MWQRARRTCFLTDHNPPHPITWAKNDHGSVWTPPPPPCHAGGWSAGCQWDQRDQREMPHSLWHPNAGKACESSAEGNTELSPEPGMKPGYRLSPLPVNSLLEMLARETKQEKELKGTKTDKEVCIALFTGNTLCTEKTQNNLPKTIKVPK